MGIRGKVLISSFFGIICIIIPFLRITPVMWRSNEQWGYYLFYYDGVEYWTTDPEIIPAEFAYGYHENYNIFSLRPGYSYLGVLGYFILLLGVLLLLIYVILIILEKQTNEYTYMMLQIIILIYIGTFIVQWTFFIKLTIDLMNKLALLNIPLLILQVLALGCVILSSRKYFQTKGKNYPTEKKILHLENSKPSSF